ncbi:hypothetical protein, partial [Sphaerotilus sp.]|uniref:hypothetical protein n=1 Tax=Sphaerotilus sp. TaxID=2093942 RepID=UPI0034E24D98
STVETTVLLNSGQCAFAASLLAIAFFIFDVTNPRRLQLASSRLKEQLDPRQNAKEPGSLEQFLKNYNEIEYLLSDFGEANRYTPASAQGPRNSRPTSSARLAEILLRNEKINKGLFFQLKRLITLRNSIIHGADPALSSDVIKASEDLIFRLKLVLGPSGHQFHAR